MVTSFQRNQESRYLDVHHPGGTSAYAAAGIPLVVIGGKDYGTGSSRDWAAKGPALLGVRAVIAESFERIHRSNLVGMGILPLQLPAGTTWAQLGIDGTETFDIIGIDVLNTGAVPTTVQVTATATDGRPGTVPVVFDALPRIDTPREAQYYRDGGILPFVAREIASA
ncbi:hypothetical protein MN2019_23830 [Mycolicibacterium neoaurum]|nr:hypothetical protein MN2019_23830 [Mycolicibacterium neoaurum]